MPNTDQKPRADALRTPETRFENLPGYDFAPNYIDDLPGYEGLRMHYLDEGPRDAEVTFLCLHGEPSWAYLYRKMIPILTAAGHRCVAPDFFGFGRSDKPKDDDAYTYHFHRNALKAFFQRMDLTNVCTINQDWGGLLGLTLPMDYPERITRMIVANTFLPTGQPAGEGFNAWKDFVANNPKFDVGELMGRATPFLSADETAAYGAPFPSPEYMGGVRRFPALVMVEPGMAGISTSKEALAFLANDWAGECFVAVGAQDMVLGVETMKAMKALIKGSSELHVIDDGGHFIQEWAEELTRPALKYFGLE